jgi:hypothetical protein
MTWRDFATDPTERPWQWIGNVRWRKREPYTGVEWRGPKSVRLKEMRLVKSKVKSIENSSRQAKQSIPWSIVTFHDDCLKMCQNFSTNFSDKRPGCCITRTHRLDLLPPPRGIFTKSNMTVFPRTPYYLDFVHGQFSLFPRLKILPFWHNWSGRGRITGGAQHPYRTKFQDAFK